VKPNHLAAEANGLIKQARIAGQRNSQARPDEIGRAKRAVYAGLAATAAR
jgi:hypothetical protein